MRANAVILLVISLLFLVGTVAAIIPDTVTITSDKTYLIANGVDHAVINVVVSNTTSGPIQGALVSLSVDPVYGTLTPASDTTKNPSGNVSSIFKVKTKSGFADIHVDVSYSDGINSFSKNSIITQKIDHDKPNKVKFIPPYEGTVNTTVAFNASFTDQWGNPIDNIINSAETHIVTVHVHGPPPDDCYFVDLNNNRRGQDLFDIPLDNSGNVPLKIKLTSSTGSNYLSMEAFGMNIPAKVIRAIPDVPVYIIPSIIPLGISPNPPSLPAGGSFTFTYTLYDKFWNPSGNQQVWINSSSSQPTYQPKNTLATTQENGIISGTFSEPISDLYTLTATAVNGNGVKNSSIVYFYPAEATSHNVVANPKMMPSRDVKSDIYSNISAKVVDGGGNGVSGQTVTFTLSGVSYSPSNVGIAAAPSLSQLSAITDANGIATVQFYPGSFVTSGPYYSQSATGNATITARWNNIPKTVDVSWKNYAYLSAVLTVKPPVVKVGDTVDINLKLNGDGWSLVPKPIDVVLVLDRSGSMAWGSPTRISSAKSSAVTFVEAMRNGDNRVGLVSFASDTVQDDSLTTNFDGVEYDINHLQANGATQLRRALYTAITDVKDNGRGDAVKAVIMMTDGDWNYDGSILGHGTGWQTGYTFSGNTLEPDNYRYYPNLGCTLTRPNSWSDYRCTDGEGTWQNMSNYAQDNNVRLYALSFVDQPSTTVQTALTVMTTHTGDDNHRGFYKHAPDASTLTDLYTQIANQLSEDAGVDTTADLDFGQLIVDDKLIDTTTPGNATFDYVGDPIIAGNTPNIAPGSTMVDKYNSTAHLIPGPSFTDIGPLIYNQTDEWNLNKALSFNIGLVKRGETWETNFRLKVLKAGTIILFSPRSSVDFRDYKGNEASLALNNLSYFTVVKDNESLVIQNILVDPVCPTTMETKDPLLPFKWHTTYTGSATTIFEEARYMSESGAWVMFYSNSYDVLTSDERDRSATFDMRRVAPGTYSVNIKAYTTGSKATSSPTCGPYLYNTTGMTFIRLN